MIFSIDLFVILGLVLILSIYSFYFGKNQATTTIISLYVGLLFYIKAPFVDKLIIFKNTPIEKSLNILAIYIVFVTILSFLIKKHIHSFDSDLNAFKSVLFGLSISIFLLSVGYFLLQTDSIHNFSPQIDKILDIFGPFYSLLVPLVILLLA